MSSHSAYPDSTAPIRTPDTSHYEAEVAGHGSGTTHHKMHGLAGWGVILGLPFAIWSVLRAIGGGADGVMAWLGSAPGAVGMTLFLAAAFLYCKMELDEVIMDYFGGGVRKVGLMANGAVALLLWLGSAAALLVTAFL